MFWIELKRHWKLAIVLFLILALRLISLGRLALSDPTESRYADIALRMLRHDQWVTPEIIIHGQEIPYWGKPPLHFWMTAFSFRIFGISEWSSRFPAYFSGLVITFFTFLLAYRLRGMRTALVACLILTSSAMFFVLSAQSSIDVTLSAAIAGAMTAHLLVVLNKNRNLWGNLFFLFLAAGMLTKGPVTLLLVFLSIGIWLAITKQWRTLKDLPWVSGTILFLMISLPWYVVAELRTPGFLRYFFLNENLLRFLVHDYGDRYGSGHVYPRGASLVMLLLTFLPWTGGLLLTFWKNWRERFVDDWQLYLFSWGLVPAFFFILSRQILATYLLPGFAGLAIAIALTITESDVAQSMRAVLKTQSWFFVVLLSAAIFAAFHYHVQPILLFAALLLFTISVLLCRRFFRESLNASVSLSAVGCALLLTVCTFVFGNEVDDTDSAKHVMQMILSDPGYSKDGIVFPFGIPYSALFYEQAFSHQENLLLHQNDWNHFNAMNHSIFIFKKREWENLDESSRDRLFIIYQTQHWVVARGEKIKG